MSRRKTCVVHASFLVSRDWLHAKRHVFFVSSAHRLDGARLIGKSLHVNQTLIIRTFWNTLREFASRVRIGFPLHLLSPHLAEAHVNAGKRKRLFVEDRSPDQEIIRVAVFFLARFLRFGRRILHGNGGVWCPSQCLRWKGRQREQQHTRTNEQRSCKLIHRGMFLLNSMAGRAAGMPGAGNWPFIPRLLLRIPLLPRPSNRHPRPSRSPLLLPPLPRHPSPRRSRSNGRDASATLRARLRTPGSLDSRLPRLRLRQRQFLRNTQGNGSRVQPPQTFLPCVAVRGPSRHPAAYYIPRHGNSSFCAWKLSSTAPQVHEAGEQRQSAANPRAR